MKYKIIACDMDETLLSSDATICQRNIEAITAAIAKGVKFVPCTGRGFRSIEGVLRTLGSTTRRTSMSLVLMGPILRKIRAADPFSGIPFLSTWPTDFPSLLCIRSMYAYLYA